MRRTVVINAVGLTPGLLGSATARLSAFAGSGSMARIEPVLPAVTCTAQATYLTGTPPNQHGIVANGWYFRDECEVKLWRQSNKLVQRPKIWELARAIDSSFTCANLFWWYNMYSSVDYSVTPRPMYLADGRKLPDIYAQPAELRGWLQAQLGQFPLFNFWGPNTSIVATRWIAEAAKLVEQRHQPALTLLYLPHLDYCLQRYGPDLPKIAQDLRDLDALCGDLLDFYDGHGVQVIILSEYGIDTVSRPVYINRLLREAGLLQVREEQGRELLDAGASAAFALADHQIAHVYVNAPDRIDQVRELLASTPGIATLLDDEGKRGYALDHPRSGELVALAEPDAWFAYYYWLDDARAPDFARTVDIHRKPGYDPVELFIDPNIKAPKLQIGLKLLQRSLGFRTLLDVIPLDASLVRGSHGVPCRSPEHGPLLIIQQPIPALGRTIAAQQVCEFILRQLAL